MLRNGRKILQSVSSSNFVKMKVLKWQSTKATSADNDSAVATQLCSKDKTTNKSQRAKHGQKPFNLEHSTWNVSPGTANPVGKRPLLLLPLVQSSVPLLQRPVRREALLLQIPVERKSLHLHPLLQRRAYLSVQRRALLRKLLAKIGTPIATTSPSKKSTAAAKTASNKHKGSSEVYRPSTKKRY
jgi:hypothetical protein